MRRTLTCLADNRLARFVKCVYTDRQIVYRRRVRKLLHSKSYARLQRKKGAHQPLIIVKNSPNLVTSAIHAWTAVHRRRWPYAAMVACPWPVRAPGGCRRRGRGPVLCGTLCYVSNIYIISCGPVLCVLHYDQYTKIIIIQTPVNSRSS